MQAPSQGARAGSDSGATRPPDRRFSSERDRSDSRSRAAEIGRQLSGRLDQQDTSVGVMQGGARVVSDALLVRPGNQLRAHQRGAETGNGYTEGVRHSTQTSSLPSLVNRSGPPPLSDQQGNQLPNVQGGGDSQAPFRQQVDGLLAAYRHSKSVQRAAADMQPEPLQESRGPDMNRLHREFGTGLGGTDARQGDDAFGGALGGFRSSGVGQREMGSRGRGEGTERQATGVQANKVQPNPLPLPGQQQLQQGTRTDVPRHQPQVQVRTGEQVKRSSGQTLHGSDCFGACLAIVYEVLG